MKRLSHSGHYLTGEYWFYERSEIHPGGISVRHHDGRRRRKEFSTREHSRPRLRLEALPRVGCTIPRCAFGSPQPADERHSCAYRRQLVLPFTYLLSPVCNFSFLDFSSFSGTSFAHSKERIPRPTAHFGLPTPCPGASPVRQMDRASRAEEIHEEEFAQIWFAIFDCGSASV